MLASRVTPSIDPEARSRGRSSSPRRVVAWVALAYGTLGALGMLVSTALGNDPLVTSSWLPVDGTMAVVTSVGLGLAVAFATILATRTMVAHASWARELRGDLRPVVQGADDTMIVLTAIAGGIGEELFFRGLLVPLVGIWLSSIGFGLLHQVRGRSRWKWAAWATIMGVVFAALFRVTGQLVGAVVAHVVINTANLRYLRDSEPAPKTRPLGGLLDR